MGQQNMVIVFLNGKLLSKKCKRQYHWLYVKWMGQSFSLLPPTARRFLTLWHYQLPLWIEQNKKKSLRIEKKWKVCANSIKKEQLSISVGQSRSIVIHTFRHDGNVLTLIMSGLLIRDPDKRSVQIRQIFDTLSSLFLVNHQQYLKDHFSLRLSWRIMFWV